MKREQTFEQTSCMLSYLKSVDISREILHIIRIKYLCSVTPYSKSSVTIHSLTPADLEYVALLQPEGWGDILPSIRFYCLSEFCYPLKATVGGKLAGIGTAIIFGTTAWLAHIIVHQEHRNAGIGTTITQSLIDLVRKTSCKTMLLIATTLGEPVYRKLGFSIQAQYLFLDYGTLPDPAAEKHVISFHPQHEQALFNLDSRVSGEDRRNCLKSTCPV